MKKIWAMAIFAIMALVLSGVAMAGTILAPAAGGTVCGTYTFRYNTTTSHTTNVTVFYSTGGAWTAVATAANTTGNQTAWTFSVNTALISDSASYKFNFTNINQTSAVVSSDYVNATNDNTGASWTFGATSTKNGDSVYIEDMVIKGTCSETCAAPIVSINNKVFNMIGSGTSYSYQFTFADAGKVPDGTYTYKVIPGVDSSGCSNTGVTTTRTVNVVSKKSPAVIQSINNVEQQQQVIQAQQSEDSSTLIIIAVVGLVVYLYYENGRKARRR